MQVCEHLQALGKQMGVRVIALVGGIAPVKQVRGTRKVLGSVTSITPPPPPGTSPTPSNFSLSCWVVVTS
jgi:hypothetical protein